MKTGKKAWIGQRTKDIDAKGKAKAPWIVFWNDPDTGKRKEKSCGPGKDGWRLAKKEAERIHASIVSGTYNAPSQTTWEEFRVKYEQTSIKRLAPTTRLEVQTALNHFERITSPGKLKSITSQTFEDYIAARREERGRKPGSVVSPATINKELRHLRAVFSKAKKLKCINEVPEFDFELEPQKIPVYVTPEHFTEIYKHCDVATMPQNLPYDASEWWRALILTAYMTGWRIGETLLLRREDVDLEAGCVKLRADTTKGRRDEVVKIHPLVIEHLERIPSFHREMFPWMNARISLDRTFHRIQKAAGIHLPCPDADKHKCTPTCHLYGFHDERRAFATLNAGQLPAEALQTLMRHRSYTTTQKYINLAKQMENTTDRLFVPPIKKAE